MGRVQEFIKYLNSHLGDAYVWGAQGQCVTDMPDPEQWVRSRERDRTNADRALRFIFRSAKKPLYAFDCSGLILHYFQDTMGWLAHDESAAGLYSGCRPHGVITDDLDPGDLVFVRRSGKIRHVGVYIGSGMTIEAYGRDLGVVMRPIQDGEWTHWGAHPALSAQDEPEPEPDIPALARTTGNVNIRAGRGKVNKRLGSVPKGTPLLALPEVNGWREVAAFDGGRLISGYMSGKYITDIQEVK